jgi:hypothetical protein
MVFGEGEDIPLTSMLGIEICRSSFREFAPLLGYPFVGLNTLSGLRMHVEVVAYNKKTLKLARDAKRKEIVLGDAYDIKTCYNILLRCFSFRLVFLK